MWCLLLFVVLVAVAGFASVMVYDLLLMIAIVACCMVNCLLLCLWFGFACWVVHCMDAGGCWVGAADGMLVWGAVFSCLLCCFGAGCIDCCGFGVLSWVWWVCYLA